MRPMHPELGLERSISVKVDTRDALAALANRIHEKPAALAGLAQHNRPTRGGSTNNTSKETGNSELTGGRSNRPNDITHGQQTSDRAGASNGRYSSRSALGSGTAECQEDVCVILNGVACVHPPVDHTRAPEGARHTAGGCWSGNAQLASSPRGRWTGLRAGCWWRPRRRGAADLRRAGAASLQPARPLEATL